MKKVLVTAEFTSEQKETMKQAEPELQFLFKESNKVEEKELFEVSALIGNVPPSLLIGKTNLEWIQLISSGVDAYVHPGIITGDTVLTCTTGAYGLAISEYMVGMLLTMMKKIPGYLKLQEQKSWQDLGKVETPYGKKILIVGCGNIGLSFAKRMRAFGCELVGIRRRVGECPKELDAVYGIEQLKAQLETADVVALCLPGTKHCYHLFDREMLLACKKGCYFMNVGRGTVVETQAFLEKEVQDRFKGIWLDVCETEPLPDQDPLYEVPNLLLTPHITGGNHLDETVENIFHITLHNLQAWREKGEFIHLVSKEDGYSLH